jgi:hypothetical protein
MSTAYTLEAWLDALAQRPLDAELWESLAVWLIDECDDADGGAWARWCWQEKLLPVFCRTEPGGPWKWDRRPRGSSADGYCPTASVPPTVYNYLPVEEVSSRPRTEEHYSSFGSAVLALLAAWRKARATGWWPEEM